MPIRLIFAMGCIAAAVSAQAPRTPDGVPDLQGFWSNTSNVVLERPVNLGAKEFYTQKEYDDLAKMGFQGTKPTITDVHYDLSQFGLDPSQAAFAPNLHTSLIIGPEGRIPALTSEAVKRIAAAAERAKGHETDGPENRGLGERCIMWPNEGPPMIPAGINNNDLQIEQGPGVVVIHQEMIHDFRIIPTDGRPHLPEAIRLWRGDSRGHWEGDTLVVETTNFNGASAFRNSTASLFVIERFKRIGDVLNYEATVSDPATWTKPWTLQIPMARTNGPLFEYACQEGNHSLENILSQSRSIEKH